MSQAPCRFVRIRTVHGAIAAVTKTWPDLPSPDEAFVAAVEARAAHDGAGAPRLEELRVDDLFVVHHAVRGQARAVAHVTSLVAGLRAALRRTGASEQAIADLCAELPADLLAEREGLPPRILGYSGRGPLGAWIRVVAVRTIVERRRKDRREPRSAGEVGERAAATHDPELDLLRRRYADELTTAFAASFDRLDADERLLLQQHHVDGLSIDRLAVLHGVHRATAARRVAAARDALFEGVRDILRHELRIGDETFDSIVRLVKSEIEINLDRHAESWQLCSG